LGLLNDILSFFIKRRSQHIADFNAYPIETQQRMFDGLISDAKRTEWGEKYHYKSIYGMADFQERVPISTYEDLFPYIERTLKGEKNVLWHSDIKWFSKSSGTTNARSKYLPVSEESLEECHYKGGKDVMTLFLQNKPDAKLFDGKGLSIGGTLHPNPYNSVTRTGDISAVIMQNLPAWAEFIRTPSLEVALLDNWEEKMERMIEICSQENVTSILGVPTWTVVLLENIMQRMNVTDLTEIWPNFEVFVHGAVSFTPYRELFQQKLFPSSSVAYMETYNASEGFFAIQDDLSLEGEMLLLLDYGIFYEFIPMEEWDNEHPKTVTLDGVELGKNYALVISTNAGLWRYKIGDTIKFTSKYPFRIKITGRTKHFINAFGEELIIENAEVAITEACHQTKISIKDFTACPIFMDGTNKGGHEWIIEALPENKEQFVQILDETLRQVNSDYDAKRYKNMALQLPKVHFVGEGTFYRWMEKRNKLGGQHKVPRLSNSREYVEDILSMLKNEN
jgi:GH3 auxin-responsive promoter